MSIFKDGLIRQGASVGTASPPYQIDQSIRFNDDDSAYLTRTQPTSTTTNKLFTISFWIKRNPGTNSIVYNGHLNGSNFNWLGFANDDTFFVQFYSGGNNIFVQTTNRKFRDPAAWYHIVYIYDSAEAFSTERTRLYVNGQRETLVQYTSNTLYPSQNGSHYWIYTGVSNNIGLRASDNLRLDAYIAELAMFQDQEYGPENFGEYNSSNIWIPKDGIADLNFGDSGFYIKGEDSSDLGNDSGTANGGAGYDFTASGLAAHDQMIDTPTNNFPTLTPLYGLFDLTLRDGNLDVQGSTATYRRTIGTQGVSTGKWYYEGYIVATTVNNPGFGWVLTNPEDWTNYSLIGSGAHEVAGIFAATGQTHVGKAYVNGSLSSSYTSTTAAGDIFGIAVDFDNQGFYIHKNGTYYNSGDPTSGASKTGSLDASGMEAGAEYIPAASSQDTNSRAHLNFGQDGTFGGRTTAGGNTDGNGIGNFKYSVPSGYLALCTRNLGS